jgi:hypothetical protein
MSERAVSACSSAGFAGAILVLGEASEGAVEAPSEMTMEQVRAAVKLEP